MVHYITVRDSETIFISKEMRIIRESTKIWHIKENIWRRSRNGMKMLSN